MAHIKLKTVLQTFCVTYTSLAYIHMHMLVVGHLKITSVNDGQTIFKANVSYD